MFFKVTHKVNKNLDNYGEKIFTKNVQKSPNLVTLFVMMNRENDFSFMRKNAF